MENKAELSKNWGFVFKKINVTCELPFKVTEDLVLRRATDEEIGRLKSYFYPLGHSQDFEFFYESTIEDYEDEFDPEIKGKKTSPLHRKEWMYYLLEFSESNSDINLLDNASTISNWPLNLWFSFVGSAVVINPRAIYNFINNEDLDDPLQISEDDLLRLRELFLQYKEYSNSAQLEIYPEIQRGILMLQSLTWLDRDSIFNILGLFSIIEMLITHNPKLEERGDSITHQLKTKSTLLSKRFDHKIDFSYYFGTASEGKIWPSLYSLRSKIVHGSAIHYSKESKLLKSADNVAAFLLNFTKTLLRNNLREPELYKDIKDC